MIEIVLVNCLLNLKLYQFLVHEQGHIDNSINALYSHTLVQTHLQHLLYTTDGFVNLPGFKVRVH